LACAAAFLIAALLLEGQKPPGARARPDAQRGAAFFQRTCALCHTVGHGVLIAPDLLGVTRRRRHAWLVTMIQRPESLLNRQDPIAVALLKKYTVRMPELKVTDAQRDDLIAYFEAQTVAHENAKAKAPAASSAGRTKTGSGAGDDTSPHR
jgi:protein SCO1